MPAKIERKTGIEKMGTRYIFELVPAYFCFKIRKMWSFRQEVIKTYCRHSLDLKKPKSFKISALMTLMNVTVIDKPYIWVESLRMRNYTDFALMFT